MLLDTDSASSSPLPAAPARTWYPRPRAPLPNEAGRLQVNALLGVARHARGATTRGDDRLEARAYLLKRLLWQWGHAQRSGHFATSVWQLVEALAPRVGWGPAPPKAHPDRERWLRSHAQNVRRWLSDLQAAGLISFKAEHDNRGQDWRTLITLHPAPEPPADELREAQRRYKAFKQRRRALRRRPRPAGRRRRGRRLEDIRRASQRPQQATRRALAVARGRAVRDHRLAAAAAANASGCDAELRTHRFTAPTENSCENVDCNTNPWPNRTGVTRARDPGPKHDRAARQVNLKTASLTSRAAEQPSSGPGEQHATSYEAAVEAAQQRVAAAEAARRPIVALIASQAAERADELASSPLDRGWPTWRIKEAWVVWRRGAQLVGEHHAGEAGPLQDGDRQLLARAAAMYEQHADRRPPGWPAGGYTALRQIAELARRRECRPEILHHAILDLDQLAKRMQAIATTDDPQRVDGQAARAARRHQPPPSTPIRYRRHPDARWALWVALDGAGDPFIRDDGELEILDVPSAPTRSEDRYRHELRDAHLTAGRRPPLHADGRAQLADTHSTYDPELGQRRAVPGPYAAPGRSQRAAPEDIELARLTGMTLEAAQRLDVDERDRRLSNARTP